MPSWSRLPIVVAPLAKTRSLSATSTTKVSNTVFPHVTLIPPGCRHLGRDDANAQNNCPCLKHVSNSFYCHPRRFELFIMQLSSAFPGFSCSFYDINFEEGPHGTHNSRKKLSRPQSNFIISLYCQTSKIQVGHSAIFQ